MSCFLDGFIPEYVVRVNEPIRGVKFLVSGHPQMVFFCDIGVGRHDLTPQKNTLLLRAKAVVRLDLTQKSSFLDGH